MDGMGKRIMDLRLARGFTRADLARLVNVTQPAVYNWEETDTRPRSVAMATLCRALGTTEDYLLTGRQGAASAAVPVKTVEQILDDAKQALATILTLPAARVKVRFEVS